jgi:hypothetical protein
MIVREIAGVTLGNALVRKYPSKNAHKSINHWERGVSTIFVFIPSHFYGRSTPCNGETFA